MMTTLQKTIDERISFLKEQITLQNKPEVNNTFQLQIDAIRSVGKKLKFSRTSEYQLTYWNCIIVNANS
jgi:hypothetical protein